MARENLTQSTNPYHYALHCLGGRWKMTILHEIHTYGSIRFNQTLKVLPLSEKVLSQQLKELISDGLVRRIVVEDSHPPATSYVLTKEGEELIPALDILYIWSIRRMHEAQIPTDTDAFVVHQADNYVSALGDIMDANAFPPGSGHVRSGAGK